MATRPSDHWEGFADLKSTSDRYKRIQQLLSVGNFEYLKKRGIASRRKLEPGLPSNLECTVNLTQFTSGFNNLVLEIAFSDGVYWIARVPHQVLDDKERTSLLSEIATLKILKIKTAIPIPQIFDFEISANQDFGYPFVFLEYLGGRTLPNGLAITVPKEHHAKVAKQLANVFINLQKLTFSRIGRLWGGEKVDQPVEIIPMAWHASPGPLETSFEYFYNQRQEENREIMAMHPDDSDWRTACWVLKTSLTQMLIEDRLRGPFPLCHLDLHFGNMLFDEEYNLVGIIDWSSAQAAPLEQLSVCPEFATFPGLSDEENQPMIEFKALVVDAIRHMERNGVDKLLPESSDTNQTMCARPMPLSTYMESKSAEITYRQYMASPRGSLFAGKMVAKVVYGDVVSWEQLREIYGTMPLW